MELYEVECVNDCIQREPLRPTLARLTVARAPDERLITDPRGGVITTATLRDATKWDDLVRQLGLEGLVRHGLRHTALTLMAGAGVEQHPLQRVAGHQDPAVTSRYLHPDIQAVLDAGTAFSAWWSGNGPEMVRKGPTWASSTAAGPEHETGPDLREQIRADSVGLTVCWFRTSATDVSRHGRHDVSRHRKHPRRPDARPCQRPSWSSPPCSSRSRPPPRSPPVTVSTGPGSTSSKPATKPRATSPSSPDHDAPGHHPVPPDPRPSSWSFGYANNSPRPVTTLAPTPCCGT